MADNLIAARTHLAWQSLAAGNNGNTTLANDFSRVALMLAGCGELAAMLGGAAKELREAAIPQTEVADLLEAVIGKAPVPAKAEPMPAVTQLPRVDLLKPAKGGAYLVELPASDALYRWQVKPGESWQTDANKQVIRAYGPMEEVTK